MFEDDCVGGVLCLRRIVLDDDCVGGGLCWRRIVLGWGLC